jgi:hypothetical protein
MGVNPPAGQILSILNTTGLIPSVQQETATPSFLKKGRFPPNPRVLTVGYMAIHADWQNPSGIARLSSTMIS